MKNKGIVTFFLILCLTSLSSFILFLPPTQAACECNCHDTGEPGESCGGSPTPGLTPWQSCDINCVGAGKGDCHTGYCPFGAKDGEYCRVWYDKWNWGDLSCYCDATIGFWDYSDGKCVRCIGNIEQYGIADTVNIYSKDHPGNGRCESACGADQECDEISPGTGNCNTNCEYTALTTTSTSTSTSTTSTIIPPQTTITSTSTSTTTKPIPEPTTTILECLDDMDCPPHVSWVCRDGICRQKCLADEDCLYDHVCIDDPEDIGGICVPTVSTTTTLPSTKCMSDSDCDDGNECTDNICINPGQTDSYCDNSPANQGLSCGDFIDYCFDASTCKSRKFRRSCDSGFCSGPWVDDQASNANACGCEPEYFTITVVDETFCMYTTDPQTVQDAFLNLNDLNNLHPHGTLLAGDGGFNQPWSWHLDPADVRMVEVSMEVCDGRPSDVENNLDYWLNTVGVYCPWGGRVTAIGCEGITTTSTSTSTSTTSTSTTSTTTTSTTTSTIPLPQTFGYDTIGYYPVQLAGYIRGSWFTIPESGEAQSITAYLQVIMTGKFRSAIYKKDGSLVAQTEERILTDDVNPHWYTFDFTSPKPILQANDYVLVVWAEKASSFYGDGELGGGRYKIETYTGNFPSSISFGTYGYKHSIYCTYSPYTPTTTIPGECPGDLNDDGKVDITDVIIVASAFGSSPGQPNWNPVADVNGDNTVDITDVIYVATYFGNICTPPWI